MAKRLKKRVSLGNQPFGRLADIEPYATPKITPLMVDPLDAASRRMKRRQREALRLRQDTVVAKKARRKCESR
jgi:hypothetical protein